MKHSSSFQNIVIVGTGSVWTEVAKQISHTQWLNGNHTHPTRIVGLANSGSILAVVQTRLTNLIVNKQISPEVLKEELEKHGVRRNKNRGDYDDIFDHLSDQGWNRDDIVFIDTTADKSNTMLEFHESVLKSWGKIVTANKNPLSLFSMRHFEDLAKERNSYKYSASVMAWAPGINALQDAYDTRNRVARIEGCFSGTLGFLASRAETKPLSMALKNAIEAWYTEPNPWDDLNGLDVARKILILARTAWFPLEMKDISVEPFLPAEFSQYNKDTIVQAVKENLDKEWESRIEALLKNGKTLRYIAELTTDYYGQPTVKVGMKEVDKSSPLGSLSGTMNKITIYTENIWPQTFEQAGAGIKVTSQWIINDLKALLPEIRA